MAETTDTVAAPKAHQDADRRRVLLLMGAVGSALTNPAAASTVVADPHPAWLAEVYRLREVMTASPYDTTRIRVGPFDDMLRIETLIATTPATTLAGVVAQLRLVELNNEDGGSGDETQDAALSNVLASVERLAGEARA